LYSKTIAEFQARAPFEVDLSLILGSGLGEFADSLSPVLSYPVSELPDYPLSTVAGHHGKVHFVEFAGLRILMFQGRIHYYEGYSLRQCLLPVELSFHAGAREIIITNAAGGINSNFVPGDLMLTSGINSMPLQKDLSQIIGAGSIVQKNDLTGLTGFPIYQRIKEVARLSGVAIKEGVYFYSKGPSYETPAEIKYMRNFGADAVGMSSVHEGVYTIARGMKPALISCITNFAAGISPKKLCHEEVTETANKVKVQFEALLKSIFKATAQK
jgi:purine-nucleoside phosphorylase